MARLTVQNGRLQDRLDKAMLVIDFQKKVAALLGHILGDNGKRI